MKKIRFTIVLPDSINKLLINAAEKDGRNRKNLVEKILSDYVLNRNKNKD
jgi:hypothetical protein